MFTIVLFRVLCNLTDVKTPHADGGDSTRFRLIVLLAFSHSPAVFPIWLQFQTEQEGHRG
jgi:hypothetical protein